MPSQTAIRICLHASVWAISWKYPTGEMGRNKKEFTTMGQKGLLDGSHTDVVQQNFLSTSLFYYASVMYWVEKSHKILICYTFNKTFINDSSKDFSEPWRRSLTFHNTLNSSLSLLSFTCIGIFFHTSSSIPLCKSIIFHWTIFSPMF